MDTVIFYPTLLSPVFHALTLLLDNDVQSKSAPWNILDQTTIDSTFHNHFLLQQGLHTSGSGPNRARKAILFGLQRHFVKNEKIIYLRKTCSFGGL